MEGYKSKQQEKNAPTSSYLPSLCCAILFLMQARHRHACLALGARHATTLAHRRGVRRDRQLHILRREGNATKVPQVVQGVRRDAVVCEPVDDVGFLHSGACRRCGGGTSSKRFLALHGRQATKWRTPRGRNTPKVGKSSVPLPISKNVERDRKSVW